MPKAKRMSDIFASSAEKDTNATITTATPPYSSEGPTLPHDEEKEKNTSKQRSEASTASKASANDSFGAGGETPNLSTPLTTVHPALYEPWTLLPSELIKLLKSQVVLLGAHNVVPTVFTKNQNVKGGINRLKSYLRAYADANNPVDLPEALESKDYIVAASAQGEGTAKLISIVDMVKRIVAPRTAKTNGDWMVCTWWMYISLTSLEIERKNKDSTNEVVNVEQGSKTQDTEEEEAFEPMVIDAPEKTEVQMQTRKVPILTVWMTKKKIPAFKEAFGEQAFEVQTLSRED